MMLRDSTDDIDSQILEHYDMNDIDEETLRGYRVVFNIANPDHNYADLDDKEFLYRMGGYDYDRHKGIEGLTMAGLMMFGKGTPVEKRFPLFRMDYLDLIGVRRGGDLKWNDRLTYDGRWENNLYNFVTMSLRKLLFTLPSEGRIVGKARRDGGALYDGVREAVINSVTYSDFQTEGVLRIDRRDDEIIIRNPGLLRISAERIYNGDFTHARNRNIQKMFRMIGYGDNIGSGFQKILAAWNTLGFLRPDLKELEDVKEVWLTLPLVEIGKEEEEISKVGEEVPKYVSIVNSTVASTVNSTVNSTVASTVASTVNSLNNILCNNGYTDIQLVIIRKMMEDPNITIAGLSTVTGLDRNAVNYQLRKLRRIINIERVGSDKKGSWKLLPK